MLELEAQKSRIAITLRPCDRGIADDDTGGVLVLKLEKRGQAHKRRRFSSEAPRPMVRIKSMRERCACTSGRGWVV